MLALVLVTTPGCVTRVMRIDSSPPGARIALDGEVVGTTPYEAEFLSYGTRRIELRLEGHRRLIGLMPVVRPWWQYFPVSFFADLLWPFGVEDVHAFQYQLEPWVQRPADWERAEAAWERLQEHKRSIAEPEAGAEDEPGTGPESEGGSGASTGTGSEGGTDAGTDPPGGGP